MYQQDVFVKGFTLLFVAYESTSAANYDQSSCPTTHDGNESTNDGNGTAHDERYTADDVYSSTHDESAAYDGSNGPTSYDGNDGDRNDESNRKHGTTGYDGTAKHATTGKRK